MPYITKVAREALNGNIPEPKTAGELNYCFTKTAKTYIEEINAIYQKEGINYQIINDVLGALEGAKLEFYRRVVVPYEDQKIIENGDAY